MPRRPLKTFISSADDLLQLDLPSLGKILLEHLKSYEGDRLVWQQAGLNRGYFVNFMEARGVGLGPMPKEPEYGAKQPEVTRRMQEAWGWLVREGLLMQNPDQPSSDWFLITSEGEKLLQRLANYERLEQFGLNRVKADLEQTGGLREVGTGPDADLAWEWVRMKENKPPLQRVVAGEWVLIAESRLDELRALQSSRFDFRKLIRLCEELNIASREDCYFATGMLTRGLLDHVPPLFGVKSFSEVANNYLGGSRSFKDTMLHLDTAAKKIADGFLHTQIRKSETLPNVQQVNFAPALDTLLGEIVRITQ